MCPPQYFEVGYAINPWMTDQVGQLNRELAQRQWNALHDALAEVAEIALMKPVDGLPDMVFTANAGTVYRDRAVVSRFYHSQRQWEEPHFQKWFEREGFNVLLLPEDISYEGAGDSLIDRERGWLWAGFGIRSDIDAHSILRDWFDLEVLSIRLIDARFYHIDTCFCPLSRGYLLYHPPAFDEASNRLIEERVPRENRIPVTVRDAGQFTCNAVNVGDHVFVSGISERLKGRLEEAGFRVVITPLTEFLRSGGSAKCLTLRVTEPAVKEHVTV